MLDIGSIWFNIKYRNEGVRLVSPEKYCKAVYHSRDTETSSGLEYLCAQINSVDDYNEAAQETLALYH